MELKEKPTHFYSIFFAEKNNRVRKRIYLYNNQQITKKEQYNLNKLQKRLRRNELQRKYFFPFKEIILF